MRESILDTIKKRQAANDEMFAHSTELAIVTEAKRIGSFLMENASSRNAVIKKAQTKFSLLGKPETWDRTTLEKIDDLIDLAIFMVANNNVTLGRSGKDIHVDRLTTQIHKAIDEAAKKMSDMIAR